MQEVWNNLKGTGHKKGEGKLFFQTTSERLDNIFENSKNHDTLIGLVTRWINYLRLDH